ncbi:MAG: hypothetical protein IKH93_04630 [Bacteroidales bacterium]|nr:hypothetical protein [Bacteroidales bacterium]
MIFLCDFLERHKYPKFYANTVAMMKGMNGSAFLSEEDFDTFYHRLVKHIEKDRPKGHAAHMFRIAYDAAGRSSIYLVSGRDETDIARLYVYRIKNIKTYGYENQATFDIFKVAESF